MLTLLSKFEAVDTQAASGISALLRELRSSVGSVGSEPGFVSYQILSSADDDCTLWVLESWRTQADADRHGQLVASNGAVDRATPLLGAPIRTSRVEPVE